MQAIYAAACLDAANLAGQHAVVEWIHQQRKDAVDN